MKLLKDQRGALAAEYAVILAMIGTAIILAAIALGNAVADSIEDSSECINSTSAC